MSEDILHRCGDTEERDSLSSKLEKCEAERAKYERWFYEKFGQAFEAEEDLDALLEANRDLQAKLDRYRTALKAIVDGLCGKHGRP